MSYRKDKGYLKDSHKDSYTNLEEIEIRKSKFWFRASLFLTAFVICLCVGLGVVSSARIDAIKTFDSTIPKILNNTCTNSSSPYYGSLNSNCVGTGSDIRNEVLYGLAYRYNNNFTNEFGYNDIYYLNSTILNASLKLGDYLVRLQNNTIAGYNTWLETYSGNSFICQSFALAFIELNNTYLNTSQRISWYNALENVTGYLTNPAISDKYYVQNQPLNKYACLSIYQNITQNNKYFLNGSNSQGGIKPYNDLIKPNQIDGIPVEWNEPIQGSTNEAVKILGYDSNYNPNSFRSLALMSYYSINPDKYSLIDGFETYTSSSNMSNWSTLFANRVNFTLNTNPSYSYSGTNSINITVNGSSGLTGTIRLALPNAISNYDIISYWAMKVNNGGTDYNPSRNTLVNSSGTVIYDQSPSFTANNVWTKFYIYPNNIGGNIINISFITSGNNNYTIYVDNIEAYTVKNMLKNDINNTIENLKYFLFANNESSSRQCGFSNRASNCYNFQYFNGSNYVGDINPDMALASMYFYNSSNAFKRFAMLTNKYWTNTDWASNHSNDYIGHTANEFIFLYKFWNTTSLETNYLLPNENISNYFFTTPNSGLTSVKLMNYIVQSSNNLTSPFGIISDVYNTKSNTHIFSGNARTTSYNNGWLTGIGVLGDTNNFTNSLDSNSKLEIISSNYPYQIRYFGNLSNLSQSKSSNNYNTIYTFYNSSIEVYQNTSSNIELQIWVISTLDIGNFSIARNDWFFTNKMGIRPSNFNLQYQDTLNNASWGQVDKMNSSGNSFNYSIILETTNNSFVIPNINNALITFSNGSVACSDISTCDGNINITLSPNNYSYVFDQANLTEGVSRTNFPITLSSSSYTSKTYTSTISNVSNLPVSFIVASCDSVGDISTSSQSWETGSYDCENYYVTLANANFQNGDTQFTIDYNQATDELCVNFAGASDSFFSFVMVFIIVGVLGFLVFLFGFSNEEIDLNILAFMILAAFLIMLFGYQIISNIGQC